MDGKGQLSADFLFATLLILIIAGSLISFVSSSADTANNADLSKAKVLANNLAKNIDSVYTDGNGQYSAIELPYDYFGNTTAYSYNVTVDSTGVTVQYKNKSITSPTIPKNIASTTVTINPEDKNTITWNVSNNNGIITIS